MVPGCAFLSPHNHAIIIVIVHNSFGVKVTNIKRNIPVKRYTFNNVSNICKYVYDGLSMGAVL